MFEIYIVLNDIGYLLGNKGGTFEINNMLNDFCTLKVMRLKTFYTTYLTTLVIWEGNDCKPLS